MNITKFTAVTETRFIDLVVNSRYIT